MPRGRARLINGAVLLASVAVAFGAGELAVRLLGLDFAAYHSIGAFCRYDEQLGWELTPGKEGRFEGPSFAVHVAISEQGLRDRVYPYERQAGRRRIVVLGDSAVWCWGVEMAECFTKQMEAVLSGTEVITMGVPGYGTAQELLLYEREGSRFVPDWVVLLFVENDLPENVSEEKRPRFRLEEGKLVLGNVPVPRTRTRFKEWMTNHSRLFAQLRYTAQVARVRWRQGRRRDDRPAGPAFAGLPPPERSRAWQVTTALLDRLHRRINEHGGRLLVVNAHAAADHPELHAYGRDRGVPVISAGEVMAAAARDGLEIRFPNDPHFTAVGNAVLARLITRALDRLGAVTARQDIRPAVSRTWTRDPLERFARRHKIVIRAVSSSSLGQATEGSSRWRWNSFRRWCWPCWVWRCRPTTARPRAARPESTLPQALESRAPCASARGWPPGA